MNLQTLHQLRLSVRSPYFARLDFTPAPGTPALGGLRPGVNAPLYIGRWGVLQTPEYRVCVYDWRSPVANLYYSGQMGPVSYEAPDGNVKGLEFDCAVIADAEDAVYPDERFLCQALLCAVHPTAAPAGLCPRGGARPASSSPLTGPGVCGTL